MPSTDVIQSDDAQKPPLLCNSVTLSVWGVEQLFTVLKHNTLKLSHIRRLCRWSRIVLARAWRRRLPAAAAAVASSCTRAPCLVHASSRAHRHCALPLVAAHVREDGRVRPVRGRGVHDRGLGRHQPPARTRAASAAPQPPSLLLVCTQPVPIALHPYP